MLALPRQISGGCASIGDIAEKLAALTDDVLTDDVLTDDVLFDDVWNRPELNPRDRSLITVAALIRRGGDVAQLCLPAGRALDNGVTATELIDTASHLAVYTGWPRDMTAVNVLKDVLHSASDPSQDGE